MAINSISQTNVSQVASQSAVKNADKPKPTAQDSTSGNNQSAPVKDTVTISNAAKAAAQQTLETLAQEAVETPQQTSQEARTGDRQAQQLLAKQAASQKV